MPDEHGNVKGIVVPRLWPGHPSNEPRVREERPIEGTDEHGPYKGVRVIYEDGSWVEYVKDRPA